MMKKIIYLFFVILFLGGCSIKDVGAPIVKYNINDTAPIVKEKTTNMILRVSHFDAPLRLLGDKIWYSRGAYKTGSYLYSSWSEDFSMMIEQNIANKIYKSGLFKSVFAPYLKAKADFLLEGEIVNAVQHVEKDKAFVSFVIRLYLIDLKSSKLVSSKDFSYHKQCNSVNALGAVKAYNDIMKIFNKEVILWLKTSVNAN